MEEVNASSNAHASTVAVPVLEEELLWDELAAVYDDLWVVLVWNDDVTTFATVITALMRLFGHTREAAEALAWQVHRSGRAGVAVLPRDEAEAGVKGLHGYMIQATMIPAGSD